VPDLELLWRNQLGPDLRVAPQRQQVHTSSPGVIGVVVHIGDDGGLEPLRSGGYRDERDDRTSHDGPLAR
jgi:hypothetical protein